MTTILELLRDHVALTVECVDWVYLNGYVSTLQTSRAVVYLTQEHGGELITLPAELGQIGRTFVMAVEAFARGHDLPMTHC